MRSIMNTWMNNQHRNPIAGLTICLVAALTTFSAQPVQAQFAFGQQLSPVERIRGAYQHTVVGASLLGDEGASVAGNASLNLNDGSIAHRVWLSWMASGTEPDRNVTLVLPNGVTYEVIANYEGQDEPLAEGTDGGPTEEAGDAGTASDTEPTPEPTDENANVIRADAFEDPCFVTTDPDVDGSGYWSCQVDITDTILTLQSLNGSYDLSGVTIDTTNPPFRDTEADGTTVADALTPAGAFSVLMVYSDPEDILPRNMQVLRGLVFAEQVYLNVTAPILPFSYAGDGGDLSLVTMGGDADLPDAGECIPDANGAESAACDFVDLCPDNCAFGYMETMSSSTNPLGNIFNETVSNEGVSSVSNTNAFDVDRWSFGESMEEGEIYDSLRIGLQAGSDAVVVVQAVFQVTDFDSDSDGLSDIQEDVNDNGEVDEGETDPDNPDTDGDGLPDGIEVNGGTDSDNNAVVVTSDPLDPDTDDDGLCDGNISVQASGGEPGCIGADQEGGEDINANGIQDEGETRADSDDTDNDGLEDFLEKKNGNYAEGKTLAHVADTDGDGLDDGSEDLNANGLVDPDESDPTLADTDNGGVNDGLERQTGRDPQDPSDDDVGGEDTDQDGVSDGEENIEGTDPNDEDSDDDGVLDGAELNGVNPTDPLDPDSDDDGLCDGDATVRAANNSVICTPGEDMNGNAIVDVGETDPNLEDTDADNLGDKLEKSTQTNPVDPDTDGDGLCDGDTGVIEDGVTICAGGEDRNLDGVRGPDETNPRTADTDQDGLSDYLELLVGNYPGTLGQGNNRTNPLVADTDGDSLIDGQEDINGNGVWDETETDPTNPDTDRGGEDDASELANGQDPVSNPGDDNGADDFIRGEELLDGDDDDCDPDLENCEDDIDYPEDSYVAGSAIWSCGATGQSPETILWMALIGCLWLCSRQRRKGVRA